MANFSKKRKFSLVDSSREMSESENMVIVPNSLQMFSWKTCHKSGTKKKSRKLPENSDQLFPFQVIFMVFFIISDFVFTVQAASNVQDESGTSKKFGFVSFERHEDAEKCVNELNGKEFGDRKLYCGRAQKKAERQAELKNKFEKLKQERIQRYQGVNLYVKNLDDSITDDILREHFSQFGTITSAKVWFYKGIVLSSKIQIWPWNHNKLWNHEQMLFLGPNDDR